MIRALLLSSALLTTSVALAPSAEAGDLSFIFGLGDRHGNSVRVKIGSRDRHVRHHDRHARTERVIRHRSHRNHRSHSGSQYRHTPRYRTISERVWVPGHFDRVAYQARLPETHSRVKVAARYEWRRDSCGRRYRVCVRRSYYKTVCNPARYETRYRQVFHKGRYESRTRRVRV